MQLNLSMNSFHPKKVLIFFCSSREILTPKLARNDEGFFESVCNLCTSRDASRVPMT